MPNIQKITPCLWFDRNAEEAVAHYLSIFRTGKVLAKTHYGDNAPLPAGTVLTVSFELHGQEFLTVNGGPIFRFTEALSLVVNCDSQDEIDFFWEKLSDGGSKGRCGWLKDRFGLSWQIVPSNMGDLMKAGDREKLNRLMAALMPMNKLDMAQLQRAYDGVA